MNRKYMNQEERERLVSNLTDEIDGIKRASLQIGKTIDKESIHLLNQNKQEIPWETIWKRGLRHSK